MTTVESFTLSSESSRTARAPQGHGTSRARGALFTAMLALAAVLVLAVLTAGTALPIGISVPLALGAIALVAGGWALGGPRV